MHYSSLTAKGAPLIFLVIRHRLSSWLLFLSLLFSLTFLVDRTLAVTFSDATISAGLATTGYTYGDPIWGDFDNDGNLDLFVDNHYNRGSYVYHNLGQGRFTDILTTSGLRHAGDRHGSAWVDFNNDGLLDLSITRGAKKGQILGKKQDELYQNLGNDTFTNVAEDVGVTNTFGRGRGVAWGDYDNDGNTDLLLGNLKTTLVLLKNNGDGTFSDLTEAAGLTDLEYTEAVFADYNNDGFQDIFCTVAEAINPAKDALFRNNGDGSFTNVTRSAKLRALTNGRSVCWGDYDNDGDLDLFISRGTDEDPLKQNLYRNNGNGTFTDVSDQSGLGIVTNNRAAAWGDYDNDGYLDLYVVNSGDETVGKGPNYLFRNNHNGTFTDVAGNAGVANVVFNRGRTCAWGDYDNDGSLDLFVTDGESDTSFEQGPQFLYHNNGSSNNWLKLLLVGTTSNHQGLGAKVTIQTGSQIQYRENNGASGHFLSQGAAPLHFGVSIATVVDQVTVNWPSGTVQVLNNVAVNQQLVVTEGQ